MSTLVAAPNKKVKTFSIEQRRSDYETFNLQSKPFAEDGSGIDGGSGLLVRKVVAS